jgi:hypothetical protein
VGWPVPRIRGWVAEHVKEGRAEQLLGQPEALLPLPADGVGLVENGGDAALFRQGRKEHREPLSNGHVDGLMSRALLELVELCLG